MKAALLKLLRNVSGNPGAGFNKKVTTFIFCLIIASFFWLVTVLSKQYTTVINISVRYVNFPEEKILVNQLPDEIGVEVKASGFRILLFKIKRKISKVVIDVEEIKPFGKKFYLTTQSRLENISKQLKSEFKTTKIYPDTLFFEFSDKAEKIVPVKLDLLIDFEKQYQLADSIRISPANIKISGAGDVIDKINCIETEKIILNKLKETTSRQVAIKQPSDKVELSAKTISVNIPVTHYTEGSVELLLEVDNLPNAYNVKTFPDKVDLKYMVAYENFNKINPSMFKAIVDYSKVEKGSNRLKVEIKQFPAQYVSEKSIKVKPEKIEYIIRKK